MKITEKEKIIITAALLHDLGKFFQRADKARKRHESYAEEIVALLPNSLYSNEEKKAIQTIIEYHHFERDKLTLPKELENEIKIVCIADRLSAHEREEKEDEEEIAKNVAKEMLINYFSEEHKFLAYPIIVIPKLKDNTFFYSNINTWKLHEIEAQNLYLDRIKNDLKEKIKNLKQNSWKDFIDSLLYILQVYLQFVPSDAYKSKPSISLFDHLKTTALIAHSLISSENEKLAIVVCEISGIQKFITQKHKKLKIEDERGYAKLIRGRSFFINLLLDAIWRRIKHEFKLYEFNLIRAVGSLVVILPYNKNIENSIEKIENEINCFLWEKFGDAPKVTFGISTIDIKELENKKGFFAKIKNAFQHANKRKYYFPKEMVERISKNISKITISEKDICKICLRNEKENAITNNEICEICKRLINIGKKLVKIKNKIYIVENKGDISFCFGSFNYNYALTLDRDEKIKEIIFYEKLELEKEIKVPIKIKFLPFYAPVDKEKENVLSFEELCKLEECKSKENSYSKLGIFKSDIDNLSHLFDSSKELCAKIFKDRESISRYSFSVFLIDYFHFVFVKNLAKKHKIYVVFSGGDDTLIAGRIDNVLKFIHEFYRYYKKYLGKLTFSAGLSFASHKYPFHELSLCANEELSRAKKNKNSFSCFSISISWDAFENMINYMKKLNELNISSSKMYKIMFLLDRICIGIEKLNEGKKKHHFEVYPFVLYFLRDLEEEKKKEAKEFFSSNLFSSEIENVNSIRLALKFSVLLSRYEENEKTLLNKLVEER
ncbi:MAG TPA: type III-A CRISPR-associated protein Cas10/Csm1 [Nanoarchaeota archaeon]|nr:type III-A CRISPR-associated protein Cas10/Csm1 [Nanoarchaeota archaeon]